MTSLFVSVVAPRIILHKESVLAAINWHLFIYTFDTMICFISSHYMKIQFIYSHLRKSLHFTLSQKGWLYLRSLYKDFLIFMIIKQKMHLIHSYHEHCSRFTDIIRSHISIVKSVKFLLYVKSLYLQTSLKGLITIVISWRHFI